MTNQALSEAVKCTFLTGSKAPACFALWCALTQGQYAIECHELSDFWDGGHGLGTCPTKHVPHTVVVACEEEAGAQ